MQLLGVAALLIATKYEEIYPPTIKDFIYISRNAFTKEEIV
jgi:cyclin B